MDLRSLLVLLDNSPACTTRTQLAIRLARERGCHLVGLAPTGLIDVPPESHGATPLMNYSALAWDALRDEAERATQRFRDECHVAGVKSHEAVIDEADKAPSVVRHAHCSDLVLLTQARPDHRIERDVVEQVVLYSARPTLIIPHTGRFDHVGNRVLVAWDDSREAARALADALPILCHSSRVEIVRWREGGVNDDTVLRTRLDALCRWLQWHGVAAHVYLDSYHGPLADAMLSRAGQIDADLIVMGAYSHPRWTQRMMGDATHGMFAAMTSPVLMSH